MRILRLLKILRISLRFGLDEFLLGHERVREVLHRPRRRVQPSFAPRGDCHVRAMTILYTAGWLNRL